MAKYTVELRKIIESGINIFDFPYVFYDEKKRKEFEQKFIRHFYFREIGAETVDRFKFYLRDKMETVFPYYNELFNAAAIKYDILDNYKLTEEITISRENTGKTSGISSTVGQVSGSQATESKQNRTVDTSGNVTNEGTDTETETTKTDTTNNSTSNTTTTDTSTGTSNGSKTTNGKNETTGNVVKKFLDTPQGQTDLSASAYLTTLNHDTEDSTVTNSGTETTTGGTSSESNGTNKTTVTGSGDSDTERKLTKNANSTQASTGKETESGTVTGSVQDEQKSTHDNNTRTYVDNRTSETQTTVRRGNIGVDTDSDAIEKHIRLQKTLKQIELMFFGECEDLFMLVY